MRNRHPGGPYRSICLGPYGGLRRGGGFLRAGAPVSRKTSVTPQVAMVSNITPKKSQAGSGTLRHRGTSLGRKRTHLGPCRTVGLSRVLARGVPRGVGAFSRARYPCRT